MNKLEQLEQEAFEDDIRIHDYYLGEETLKGFYIDGNIAINTSVSSETEKACIIAEELGHHHTSVGDIINMSDSQNRKQERQARLWGYNKLIGLNGIIKAFQAGHHSRHDAAEYLEVTEEFLQECIDCYRDKYGEYAKVDNYTIFFIPNLSVIEEV
ncbi:ImmA/IrrE family metallo-endopeptidase [Mediterraneibacter agrestimuris]|uniref:ImmA/IrrE family metallo-endopeptidase n=1 Tax=Mediterraneibacter agrestimuris TaxID=2941333 RepID=UPI00203E83E8|nr:ImmA/IrrE family metallo-endopeptidase [Mediterraneibacter agrestimuris]